MDTSLHRQINPKAAQGGAHSWTQIVAFMGAVAPTRARAEGSRSEVFG
jgi:hypothetical protein